MHSLEGAYAYEGEVSGVILADTYTVLFENEKGLNPDLELMQYTGLKDKNGKEIYEGDILEVYDDRFTVFWRENEGGFYAQSIYNEDDCYTLGEFHGYSVTCYCLVIGNIHENPELLEAA